MSDLIYYDNTPPDHVYDDNSPSEPVYYDDTPSDPVYYDDFTSDHIHYVDTSVYYNENTHSELAHFDNVASTWSLPLPPTSYEAVEEHELEVYADATRTGLIRRTKYILITMIIQSLYPSKMTQTLGRLTRSLNPPTHMTTSQTRNSNNIYRASKTCEMRR